MRLKPHFSQPRGLLPWCDGTATSLERMSKTEEPQGDKEERPAKAFLCTAHLFPAAASSGLLNDSTATRSRPAGALVLKQDDFTIMEKDSPNYLVKPWQAIVSRTGSKTKVVTPNKLFHGDFAGWHTDLPHEIGLPVFPSTKGLHQSCVEAGTRSIDLKDASKAKVQAQGETSITPESESPKKRQAVQLCSAKAFPNVAVDDYDAEVKWLWKDESGQAAPNDVVDFREGLKLEDWQMRCIQNHDYHEQRLTYHSNEDLVTASARQLMIQRAKDSTTSNGMPVAHMNSSSWQRHSSPRRRFWSTRHSGILSPKTFPSNKSNEGSISVGGRSQHLSMGGDIRVIDRRVAMPEIEEETIEGKPEELEYSPSRFGNFVINFMPSID